jgi:hypothetical protein
MANFVIFDEFLNYRSTKKIDLTADTFKAVLTNTAPTKAGSQVLADIVQIANGNGYTTGGVALTTVTYAETGAGTGIWKFSADDFSWTAAGGSIGPFRYAVVYDDTPVSPADPLVGYVDLGSAITLTDGNGILVDVGANGLFQDSAS